MEVYVIKNPTPLGVGVSALNKTEMAGNILSFLLTIECACVIMFKEVMNVVENIFAFIVGIMIGGLAIKVFKHAFKE